MAVHRVFCILQMRSAHDGYLCLRVNIRRSRKLAKQLVALIVVCCAIVNSIRFFFYRIDEVRLYPEATETVTQLLLDNQTFTPTEDAPLAITPPFPLLDATGRVVRNVQTIRSAANE